MATQEIKGPRQDPRRTALFCVPRLLCPTLLGVPNVTRTNQGLNERVLKLKGPKLVGTDQPMPCVRSVRSKVVGIDTAMALCSDIDTDAESLVGGSAPASLEQAGIALDGDIDDASDADWELSEVDEARSAPGQKRLSPPLGCGDDDDGDDGDDGEDGGDGDDDESDAVPEDIDLPDDVWEQQVEDERVVIEAEAEREASLLSFAPRAPLNPVDAQPPRLTPAIKREPIPLHRLKKATLAQVLACSQYWQKDAVKSNAFYQRWKTESKAHRAKVRAALEAKQRKDKAFAEAKAAREAEKAARTATQANEEADKRESRGWNQLVSQGAKKEKAEGRLARGKGTCFVVPTEETNDRKAGTIAKIHIGQLLPPIKIKIPNAALEKLQKLQKLEPRAPPEEIEVGEMKAVRLKLAGSTRPLRRALPAKCKAPEQEEEEEEVQLQAGPDPYARAFKPRRRAAT